MPLRKKASPLSYVACFLSSDLSSHLSFFGGQLLEVCRPASALGARSGGGRGEGFRVVFVMECTMKFDSKNIVILINLPHH
jgi:hypothetical protein